MNTATKPNATPVALQSLERETTHAQLAAPQAIPFETVLHIDEALAVAFVRAHLAGLTYGEFEHILADALENSLAVAHMRAESTARH